MGAWLAITVDARLCICFRDGVVIGEIDIDSDQPSAFGETDQVFLEHMATLLAPVLDTVRDVATQS